MKFLRIEGYLIRSLPSEHKFHLVSQTNGAIFKSTPFVCENTSPKKQSLSQNSDQPGFETDLFNLKQLHSTI